MLEMKSETSGQPSEKSPGPGWGEQDRDVGEGYFRARGCKGHRGRWPEDSVTVLKGLNTHTHT